MSRKCRESDTRARARGAIVESMFDYLMARTRGNASSSGNLARAKNDRYFGDPYITRGRQMEIRRAGGIRDIDPIDKDSRLETRKERVTCVRRAKHAVSLGLVGKTHGKTRSRSGSRRWSRSRSSPRLADLAICDCSRVVLRASRNAARVFPCSPRLPFCDLTDSRWRCTRYSWSVCRCEPRKVKISPPLSATTIIIAVFFLST